MVCGRLLPCTHCRAGRTVERWHKTPLGVLLGRASRAAICSLPMPQPRSPFSRPQRLSERNWTCLVSTAGEALMPRTERIQAEEASYEERSLIGSRLPPGFKVPMGKVFFWLCWAGLYPLGAHWRTFFPAFMGFDYQTARKCGVPRKLEIKFVFLRKKA